MMRDVQMNGGNVRARRDEGKGRKGSQRRAREEGKQSKAGKESSLAVK